MFGGQIYIEATIYEIQKNGRAQYARAERHFRGDPAAEGPRSGVGLVHEVFRRIVGA